jgi:hypothetical protein
MKPRTAKPRLPSFTAIEDAWLREATRATIEKARAVIADGAVPPMTSIGRLSDIEWGWVVASVIFGWISTRARQATLAGPDGTAAAKEIDLPF